MSIAEIIYAHSRRLPDQAAREALSYIEYLEQRYGVRSPKGAEQDDTEAFLATVAGGLSADFPDDITNADLGADSPRQDLDFCTLLQSKVRETLTKQLEKLRHYADQRITLDAWQAWW